MVTDREGRPLRAFPAEGGRWRFAADLEEVDPLFIEALLAVEDKRFYSHGGVDWLAMVRAAATSASAGRVVSGGSTITMQTARLLEPRPRTIGSKLIEFVRATQIELRLSKREILELYLTLAPYGGNLEGVRAASWSYFGHAPDRLSDDQIALLIALPQSPEARRPDRRPEAARAGRAAVAAKLVRLGVFDDRRADEAMSTALPSRRAFPARAWHPAAKAYAEAGGADTVSTLDAGLQSDLEGLLQSAADRIGPEVQLAAMVVDIETRAVRAAAGSATRDRPGGWIDLTRRARSPGSTLKPFIYAIAFDDGAAAPTTRIADLPKRFAAYNPENFDRSFRGDVTIAQALQHSLNVPAVLALDRIGPGRFAAALALAGAPPQVRGSADEDAGLALALGGAGLTMRDLARLYAALGDDGVSKPIIWLADQEVSNAARPGRRFVSAASAERVLRILRDSPAPAGRAPSKLAADAPQIAFKTGTSYGYRDAWAAGVSGGHAIIVWVGRADGAPRPGKTGRSEALPLLFDLADRARLRLDHEDREGDRARPERDTRVAGPLDGLGPQSAPPEILFPPHRAELWAGAVSGAPARAFVFAGRGQGRLRWFIDGAPAEIDAAGQPIWRPETLGFYTVTAVDGAGRAARAMVRVMGAPASAINDARLTNR